MTEEKSRPRIYSPFSKMMGKIIFRVFFICRSLSKYGRKTLKYIKTDSCSDFYPKKFDHYHQLHEDIHKSLQKYINFDVDCLLTEYKTLPFDKFYSNHEFKRVSIVKTNTLFDLVELKRSTSYYQLFRNDHLDQIRKCSVADPVEEFANAVLLTEGLIDGIGNNVDNDNRIQLMKSVKLDTLWTFFVHILHN